MFCELVPRESTAPGSTDMDDPMLVSFPTPVGDTSTNGASTDSEPFTVQSGRDTFVVGKRVSMASHLAFVRNRRIREQSLSEGLVELLLDSNRKSTSATYQSAWNSWCDWNDGRSVDPASFCELWILFFLFSSKKAYNSTNIAGSMLSLIPDKIDGFRLGSHSIVIKLMKGI